MRSPLKEPDSNQLFELITGESDYSLYVGLKVGCKILETRGNSVNLVIDNGIRGFARISQISDERVDDVSAVLRVRTFITIVILLILNLFPIYYFFYRLVMLYMVLFLLLLKINLKLKYH